MCEFGNFARSSLVNTHLDVYSPLPCRWSFSHRPSNFPIKVKSDKKTDLCMYLHLDKCKFHVHSFYHYSIRRHRLNRLDSRMCPCLSFCSVHTIQYIVHRSKNENNLTKL